MNVTVALSIAGILMADASHASAQTPTTSAPPPLTIAGAWDSAPHNLSTARNLETVYALYGLGVDALFHKAGLERGATGVVARLARSPLDAYVAWLVTLTGHEFGHCQQAWLGGSHDCQWIAAPGPYALGHVIFVGDAGSLSAAGRMSVTAGGTQASVAAADALKREMFAAGHADWTASPLLAFRQLDLTLYGLTSPSPSHAGALDYANDMTNYALRYGLRSGQGGDSVHTSIVHGALWNGADPMTWFAVYRYFGDYVAHGDRTSRAADVRIGGRAWIVTTNAWLSEVGVRYALGAFSRGGSGDVVEVTPSWGEGQPAIAARWSHEVRSSLRLSVRADVWHQRASAAPGPLETGGSIGAGLSTPLGPIVVSGDAGYKTTGVMLARPQAAGWFFSIGSAVRVRR